MSLLMLIAAQAAETEILVTASRTPVAAGRSGVSATIVDDAAIEAQGYVQAIDLLRLTPGVSVSVSGARGTQAQLRIRGAEANHSLLFIDGIRFNDPAAGNEARFEILSSDNIGRVEIVRGPQSALWGADAIGGVIALTSPIPLPGFTAAATGEAGSHDSLRASATAGYGGDAFDATASLTHLESDGIDVLGGGTGDRDGFENRTASARLRYRPGADSEIGLAGRYIDHHSDFDGLDPVTFTRADTADNSRTRTGAVRAYASVGLDPASQWAATVEAQYLGSRNRNRDGAAPLNRTSGARWQASAQVERRLSAGATRHVLIGAVEAEGEDFSARDQIYFGGTDQDSTRNREAYVAEWRAQWGGGLTTHVAVRHDDFNRFEDETTFRAAASLALGKGVSITGAYGEGIAQPTFVDLFGFFPGSFVGNPGLTPETSRGAEVGLRWQRGGASAAVTLFDARLRSEIVPVFDPVTFLSSTANASGTSRRRGIEVSGAIEPLAGLRIGANYTYLDAEDQQVAGTLRVREARRPRHAANATADWRRGPLTLGAALAYVGTRRDADFDLFPAPTVILGDYLLASARMAYRITDAVEMFGRVENAGDADYQDVVGYATPGRTVHAGLRLRLGR